MLTPPQSARLLAATLAGLALCLLADLAQAQVQLAPGGAVGLRHRAVVLTQGSPDERQANRLESLAQARLDAQSPDGALKAQLRLSTGDPGALSSPWSSLSRYGAAASVSLDRAWASARLDALPLELTVGQWQAPWARDGLLWDRDVDLPGALLTLDLSPAQGSLKELVFNPGLVYLAGGSPEFQDEVWLYAGEARALWAWEERSLELALGCMGVNSSRRLGRAIARGDLSVGLRPKGFTANTTDTDAQDPEAELTRRLVRHGLASAFHVVSLWAAWQTPLAQALPLRLHLQGAVNLGADGPGQDQRWAAELGARLGEARQAGDGQVTLRGLWIQADAVLDVFNRELYGTNLTGVGLDASLMALQGWTVGFESVLGWRADPALRGLGAGRAEPGGAQGASVQLHVVTQYEF